MDSIELCNKCHSIDTCELETQSAAKKLLAVLGYHTLRCKSCGFSWGQFLPVSALLNLIYLLLAVEVAFLATNYIR